jgi:hypothetical protein
MNKVVQCSMFSVHWMPCPLSLLCPLRNKHNDNYSETCEIRTLLGPAKGVPNSEVSSFQRAISTENSILGPDEVSLFHRMSSFRRVAIPRFHCITLDALSSFTTLSFEEQNTNNNLTLH